MQEKDTIATVAEKFNVSTIDIIFANQLYNSQTLYTGQVCEIFMKHPKITTQFEDYIFLTPPTNNYISCSSTIKHANNHCFKNSHFHLQLLYVYEDTTANTTQPNAESNQSSTTTSSNAPSPLITPAATPITTPLASPSSTPTITPAPLPPGPEVEQVITIFPSSDNTVLEAAASYRLLLSNLRYASHIL